MRSYDIVSYCAPLEAIERPTPIPEGSQIVLRVRAAGVCHTDLHIWEGGYDLGGGKMVKMSDRGQKLPHTMGHETVGEVVAIGPDAEGVAVGDVRLVYPWIGCGSCDICRSGQEQLCGSPRFLGVFRGGGYSDHIVVPHPRYLIDIGRLSPAEAAPLACSGLTTYACLKRIGPAIEQGPIMLIGAGGLGLMCLNLLSAMGGKGAVVVDPDPSKREAALAGGALAAIDPKDPQAAVAITAAAGGPVRAAIDFVGSPESFQTALSVLGKPATYVIVGLFGGEMKLSVALIPLRAMTVVGMFTGSRSELQELVTLCNSKSIPPIPIQRRPLTCVNETLRDLKNGRLIGRAILIPVE